MIINLTQLSERTGVKANTIWARFNTLRRRYPGLGIVASAKGATRQGSGVGSAKQKVDAATSVKKAVVKTVGRETRSEKVEVAEDDEDEEGEDDSNKRQTRAKKRVEQKVSDKKTKVDQREDQTRALTGDDDAEQPAKETKSRKKSATKRLLHVSDEDADDSENTDIEEEAPVKKTATPKTRGGRKSAGIETIGNLHVYPERPAPRGRHAVAKKDEVADTGIMQDDTVESDAENAEKDGDKDHPTGTKRKRAETPELPSSPLTPSPAIRRRLDDMGSHEQEGNEVGHQGQSELSDIPPPSKKQKLDRSSERVDSTDAEAMIEENGSTDVEGPVKAEQVVTLNQESISAEVEGVATDLMKEPVGVSSTSAGAEQHFDKNTTTPLGHSIDEMSSPSGSSREENGCAGEDGQIIEAPESPIAGRGRSTKPAHEVSDGAVSPAKATASESPTVQPKVLREDDIVPDPSGSGIREADNIQSPITRNETTTENTSAHGVATWLAKVEAPSHLDPENPVLTNAKPPISAKIQEIAKKLEQPESKRRVSKGLDWKLWNPTPKPSKP